MYPRRECDKCVAVIDGMLYPVEDWSQGGMLMACDTRLFRMGQEMKTTLKFKLSSGIMDVAGTAKIVRKNDHQIGLQFTGIDTGTQEKMGRVIEDFNLRSSVN